MEVKVDSNALQEKLNTLIVQAQDLNALKVEENISGGSGLCHVKCGELINAYNALNEQATTFLNTIVSSLNGVKDAMVKLDEDLAK